MAVSVAVWSDIACPWCFVGKQRLERALEAFYVRHPAVQVDLVWRAFELDPRPREPDARPYAERLAQKYGRSIAEAKEMISTMASNIEREGGRADFDNIVVANTFDAHRLIQWAADQDGLSSAVPSTKGAQHRLTDAFMRGYLGRGLDLSSEAQMLAVVEGLHLDKAGAAAVLSGDAYADRVREDEALAQHYGISGVPFFVIGPYGLSGAQESHTLLEVLEQALSEAGSGTAAEPNADKNAANRGDRCDIRGGGNT